MSLPETLPLKEFLPGRPGGPDKQIAPTHISTYCAPGAAWVYMYTLVLPQWFPSPLAPLPPLLFTFTLGAHGNLINIRNVFNQKKKKLLHLFHNYHYALYVENDLPMFSDSGEMQIGLKGEGVKGEHSRVDIQLLFLLMISSSEVNRAISPVIVLSQHKRKTAKNQHDDHLNKPLDRLNI